MRNHGLGILLILITFPLIILSLIFLSTRTLSDSEIFKNILLKNNSYSKITDVIQQTKTEDDLTNTFITDITPSWLQINSEGNLDILFSYLNKKRSEPNFSIDIASFQADLQKQIPSGTNIVVPSVLSFTSYKNFLNQLSSNNSDFSKFVNAKNVQSQLDQINNIQIKTNQNLSNFQRGLYYYKMFSYIIFALTILMLIIIAIAAKHYLPAIPRWIGYAIFIPSASFFLIIYMLKIITLHYSLISLINLSTDAFNIINPIYQNFLQIIFHNFIFYSFVFTFIGLILVIASYIWGEFKPIPKIIKDHNVQVSSK